MKTILNNKFFEYSFILFPVWIFFVYYPSKILLPFSDELIFLIFLLLFGETHFASTYLFFLIIKIFLGLKKIFLKF